MTAATPTAVLIAGAGPTGLTLACTLARAGVPVRIIDKSPEFHRGSRGKGLNQRSRELFDDLGVGREAAESGSEHIALRKYRHGVAIADSIAFDDRAPTPDTPYASGLLIPQWRIEEILRGRLAEYGVEVELGRELTEFTQTEFTQDGGGVTAHLADGGRIEAAYLVGCDGGHSRVRKALGIAFDGETEAEECMVIGDVRADGLDPAYWHQWFDEDAAIMLCPFPGTAHWQLQGSPERDAEGRLVPPSLETFQRLFDRCARRPDIRLTDPTWTSVYRINVRMADRFRVGRVFLAGDAAHVHSIAGGLGMNTGIQDAFNLGWKLAFVLRGLAGPALLDTYEEERLPVAAWTLNLTNERLRAVVEGIKEAGVGTETVVTDDITTLGVSYPWSSLTGPGPLAGERAPDGKCAEGRLFEAFAGTRFTLLGFGPGTTGALARALDGVGEGAGEGIRTVLVDDDDARKAYGLRGEGLVLVRPDNHVAMSVGPDRAEEIASYLKALAG
ncbi:2-polyprenyl-6-methoxyphenol hydroxylase-like FAD-dependent oxidoreductase [Streptomyces olivoverticillatus]|uniref:2-polyprenyl-6-methoxyphenol hydroxylase-like FAD-dependent oxidoreductase n=1 Tax=Streptomyces olivoverticillatus TaxID=66427 RepID=A0A7W7LIZ3_9ACTN|nr:FAD-dependent monooxygenase [Streptomyces olivoverticillatus]MBB4891115.1 2-polyprenyl-6-methoxyphenol hydroxylase-like FAD-dependent oxidoreductase [Streptomyces olivoverticillatus]